MVEHHCHVVNMTAEHTTDTATATVERSAHMRPELRLNEAAKACNVSRSTMRRKREAGEFQGAHVDSSGAWVIPVEDLLAAGLSLTNMGTAVASGQGREHPVATPEQTNVEGELARERELRRAAEQRADEAERLAAERAAHIEDLRLALRAIEAAPRPPQPVGLLDLREPRGAAVMQLAPEPAERQRTWYGRRIRQ